MCDVATISLRTNSKTWHNEYTAKSFRREPTVWDFISVRLSVIESLSVATIVDYDTVMLCLMQLTTHQMIVVFH